MLPAILTFVVVATIFGGAFYFMRDASGIRASERLEDLMGRGPSRDSSAELLLREALKQDGDKKPFLERITPEMFKLEKMFVQADVNVKPSALFGVALGLGFMGAMLMTILMNPYVAPVGAFCFFALPFLWLWFKRASRLKAFQSLLPDSLELVARALRAGHSLAAGLHVVAEEMPGPIAKEFARVYEEQNLGIPLEEALKSMCYRVPSLDLRFFVTSVAIQRQTGGDLAEILERIGYVIRERFKILGQVKSLTAEGRLSGLVLIALPIGLFLLMLQMKPDYIKMLWEDPMGVKMSIGAIVLMLIGSFAIKKIVDIKV